MYIIFVINTILELLQVIGFSNGVNLVGIIGLDNDAFSFLHFYKHKSWLAM